MQTRTLNGRTDGVHDVLINDLEAIVGKNANASAGVIARKLVDQALPSTRDNATCAVVTIR
jgi:serine/threonine protein phosphatase PrpC